MTKQKNYVEAGKLTLCLKYLVNYIDANNCYFVCTNWKWL